MNEYDAREEAKALMLAGRTFGGERLHAIVEDALRTAYAAGQDSGPRGSREVRALTAMLAGVEGYAAEHVAEMGPDRWARYARAVERLHAMVVRTQVAATPAREPAVSPMVEAPTAEGEARPLGPDTIDYARRSGGTLCLGPNGCGALVEPGTESQHRAFHDRLRRLEERVESIARFEQ